MDRPLQLVVAGHDGFRTFLLPDTGSTVVGRGDDADIRLDDGRVSRRHASLHVSPQLTVEDLGSANGTLLRGRRLAKNESAPLSIGESVQIGSVLFFVQRSGAAGARPKRLDEASGGDESLAMQRLRRTLDRVALGHINVLIMGETGAGKDVLARYLHSRSLRAARPFVRVNCATLSESLLESELFGHERGSFTGAGQAKPGLLETAEGGTAFLDEVGELPLRIQAKLLAVLETKQMTRVGSVKSRAIDVRFVAATNRDLEAEVEAGRFRSDLYFRLNGFSTVVPPLRERSQEIAPLARLFILEASGTLGLKTAPVLSDEAARVLGRHRWPGNVRELRNVIERAVILCEGDQLLPAHLPFTAAEPVLPARPTSVGGLTPAPVAADLAADLDPDEREHILSVLASCGGNQTQAARILKMARGTLLSRLQSYGVPRPRSRFAT